MGKNRPVKTSDFKKFLKANNCRYLRTKASHEHWKCPKCWRTISFVNTKKEIPALHIKTCMNTLGKTPDELYKWIEEN